MSEGGDLVLRHLGEAAAQVVTHGLNCLAPGARQAVADALNAGTGDIAVHIWRMSPLTVSAELVTRSDPPQRVHLFHVASPDATTDDASAPS